MFPPIRYTGGTLNLHLRNASKLNNHNLQGQGVPKNQNTYNTKDECNNDEHGKKYAQLC